MDMLNTDNSTVYDISQCREWYKNYVLGIVY